MGASLLYKMAILKCGFRGPSGGSAGRIITYICPLIKGHSFGDDLFYRIVCLQELGKGTGGGCAHSLYKERTFLDNDQCTENVLKQNNITVTEL